MEPASNEAMSGFRASGARRSSMEKFRPGMPLVVRQRTRSVFSRSGSTTRRKTSTSWLPSPVLGSRTWMCTTAAPARQHSIADCAISSGVSGMYGAISRIIRLPVIAAVMITLSSMMILSILFFRPVLSRYQRSTV